jgi:phosphatidylserine decarboxylase
MVVSAGRIAAESLRVLPRKRLSRMMGRLADLEGPQPLVQKAIDTFVRVYGVDLSEYDVPSSGWESFDAFFTRPIRAGARPVDPDPRVAVCPADGRLEDAGPIDRGATLRVKGKLYDVGELLGDAAEAARFDGGTFVVVYLAPPDYHRVHASVAGPVTVVRHVPGTLYPVNLIGTEHVPRLFARNERVVVHQHSEAHGEVATIMVGAIGVGRIGLAFDDVLTNSGIDGGSRSYGNGSAPRIDRGGEIGMFHLGSTVIVFFPRSHPVTLLKRPGERTKMGQGLARA